MNRARRLTISATIAAALVLGLPVVAAAAPGDLDASFGTAGVTSLAAGTALNGVAVQPDRSVVAVGSSGGSLLVERFSSAGAPAGTSAAGSGVGRAVVVQSDGKFVVAGNDSGGMLVERFNANGSLDTGFGSHGVVHAVPGGRANAVAIGPNGTIVAAGQVPGVDGFQRVAVLRLNSNGAPDTTLGAGGVHVVDLGQDSIANGVAVQGDGKIVIDGVLGPGAHQVTNAIAARLTPAGALDPTFANHGIYEVFPQNGGAELTFNALALDPAGAFVLGGAGTTLNQSAAVFVRLTCSGQPDHSFAGAGALGVASSRNFVSTPYGANGVAVVTGRRVVGAGQYQDSGLAEAGLWGFESSGSADFAKMAPFGARSMALAVDPAGNLVVAGTNVPAGFLPSGFVARYAGFGGPATGSSPCGGAVVTPPSTPALTGVGQSHRTWGETRSKKLRRPVGTSFSFTLNASARVTLTFTQRVKGRKVKGRCVSQTSRNRRNRSCTLTLRRGSFSAAGKAGRNAVSFSGRISRSNLLKPGTYTVVITATSSSGKKSKPQSLTFTIVS